MMGDPMDKSITSVERAALELWMRGQWTLSTGLLPAHVRDQLADAADAVISSANETHQRASTPLEPLVDRWWAGRTARVYLFAGGPISGHVRTEPVAFLPAHCMATISDDPWHKPQETPLLVWAPADAWAGLRYAPDCALGPDVTMMVWREATTAEISLARARRAERDADRAHEIALDEAASSEDDPS
jgi:hypothetical protein